MRLLQEKVSQNGALADVLVVLGFEVLAARELRHRTFLRAAVSMFATSLTTKLRSHGFQLSADGEGVAQ